MLLRYKWRNSCLANLNLDQPSIDGILEPLNDGDHTSLINDEAKTAGVRVIESSRPRRDDTSVRWVVL
jgi:hypothetical protein